MPAADGITVRAIAGTHAVILGMDATTEESRRSLLGFGIGKRLADGNIDPAEQELIQKTGKRGIPYMTVGETWIKGYPMDVAGFRKTLSDLGITGAGA